MTERDPRPFLVLTVLLDSSGRAAAITRSHGDAVERAMIASHGHDIAGLDIVELPIAPKAFEALRTHLHLPDDAVAVYDIFPLASHLSSEVRTAAGQFLAAEALWTLEGNGMLAGVPPNEKLNLPPGWDKAPKAIREKLMEAGAHDLAEQGIETYKAIKTAWDATPS